MIKLVKTNSKNTDFIELISQLDAYLAEIDGEEHTFYNQFNKIDTINHVIVCYENFKPVGCGAIKNYNKTIAEIKRMYTTPESRGKGVATKILKELQLWAAELGYKKCILETGIRQQEAVSLYKKNGFLVIPSYGQYKNVSNSICFEKEL